MKGSKLITFIFTANLLLVSCRSKTNTILGNSKKPVVAIASLANGNYHYCSEPNPNKDKLDGNRYCFTFSKTDTRVIGSYLYRAPRDVPIVCVEGEVKNNQVTGVGYEGVSPGA